MIDLAETKDLHITNVNPSIPMPVAIAPQSISTLPGKLNWMAEKKRERINKFYASQQRLPTTTRR
jgi:hypothetical protein